MKLKRGFKQFLLRLTIFVALIYIILPLSFRLIVHLTNSSVRVQLNYLYNYLFVSLVILIFVLSKRKELSNLKPYKQNIPQTLTASLVALILFKTYFYIKYGLNSAILGNPIINITLLYSVYFIAGVALLFAIFNNKFVNKFYRSLLIAIFTGIVFFELTIFLRMNWFLFSDVISKVSYSLLNLNYTDASLAIKDGIPILGIGDFKVNIGAPCSGIDSLAMFTVLFLLVLVYDWDKLNKKKTSLAYVIGIIGIFATVILRIYLLMVIGAKNPSLALGLFHENASWVIFVAYFFLFFYLAYPRIKIQKS